MTEPSPIRVIAEADGVVYVGTPPGDSAVEYEASWDYELAMPPPAAIIDAVFRVLSDRRGQIDELGLPIPTVHFVEEDAREDETRVAIYITGTSQGPHMAVVVPVLERGFPLEDPEMTAGERARQEMAMYREVTLSILHELGHAYLEALGVDATEFEHDEKLVERAAHIMLTDDVERAREILDAWGEGVVEG